MSSEVVQVRVWHSYVANLTLGEEVGPASGLIYRGRNRRLVAEVEGARSCDFRRQLGVGLVARHSSWGGQGAIPPDRYLAAAAVALATSKEIFFISVVGSLLIW